MIFKRQPKAVSEKNASKVSPKITISADQNATQDSAADVEPPRKTSWFNFKFLFGFAYWFTVVAIWFVVFIIGVIAYYALMLPDPLVAADSQRPANVKILSDKNKAITTRGLKHIKVPLEKLPQHAIDAVLSIEDSRFYHHFGFDPFGIIRATFINYQYGTIVQGGSTVTQQLAKNLYFTSERTFARKLQEVIAALWLEVRLQKSEILEIYMNTVYFGAGAYGIEAAARRYFDKSARNLTLPEAALLAGLLKAPSRFSPTNDLDTSYKRAKLVLDRMQVLGKISKEQMAHAIQKPAKINLQHNHHNFSYILDWIIEDLPGYIGSGKQDIIVHTTINKGLQNLATDAVVRFMDQNAKRARADQAAVVMLSKKGAIKALVGGRSYEKSQFNRVTKAKRQPGSAFKPFIYLAALEAGFKPQSVIYDRPVNINGWRPQNYGGYYRGRVDLKYALTKSINTVAVRLMRQVGIRRVLQIVRRLGITSEMHSKPSLALGTAEVSLLELTAAYVPFANGGYGIFPYVIRKITNKDGKVLYKRRGRGPGRVVRKRYLKYMNSMLQAVILHGTGRDAYFPGQALAGKTGTSQNFRDAWFLGYSPYYTAGVWVGNDNNRRMRGVTGGSLPAAIWRYIMLHAHKKLPSKNLPGVYARL